MFPLYYMHLDDKNACLLASVMPCLAGVIAVQFSGSYSGKGYAYAIVPEPNAISLFGVGILLLYRRLR